jgi:hypothetical protein
MVYIEIQGAVLMYTSCNKISIPLANINNRTHW